MYCMAKYVYTNFKKNNYGFFYQKQLNSEIFTDHLNKKSTDVTDMVATLLKYMFMVLSTVIYLLKVLQCRMNFTKI